MHTPFVFFFVFQLAIPLWYSFCIRAIKHCIPLFVLHTLFYGIYAIVCCLILVEQYIRATIPCHSQHIPRYILSMYIRVVQGLCRIIELYHFILPDFSVGTVARSWRRISHSIWFWCVNIFDSAIVMSWEGQCLLYCLYITLVSFIWKEWGFQHIMLDSAFGQCQVSSWVNFNYIPVCIVLFCSLLRRNRHCRTYLLGCKMESQLVLVSKDIYCEWK